MSCQHQGTECSLGENYWDPFKVLQHRDKQLQSRGHHRWEDMSLFKWTIHIPSPFTRSQLLEKEQEPVASPEREKAGSMEEKLKPQRMGSPAETGLIREPLGSWATATTVDIQTIQLQRFGAMSLNTSMEWTGDIALCLFVERQVASRL